MGAEMCIRDSYYVGRDIARETAKASMIGIFGVSAFTGIGSGAAIGVLDWSIIVLGLLLFPVVLAGNWLGARASGKVSDPVWRSVVGVVLGAAALAAMIRLF